MKERKQAEFLAFIFLAVIVVVLQVGFISLLYWLLTLCFPITFKFQYAVGVYIILNILKLLINFIKN